MSASLPMNIALFSGALISTIFMTVYLFVRKHPQDLVFWKRSDYVYFAAAIVAATLAFVNQSSNNLQSEIVALRIEKNNLASRIVNSLLSFQEGCRLSAEEQLDRRGGIIRPQHPRELLFPVPPTETECNYIEEAILASGMMTDDPARACAPYDFPRTGEDYSFYDYQLAEPNALLVSVCAEIAQRSKRLSYVQWLDPINGFWPAFLGFAFGVRLTRVHAEVREELSKSGQPSRPPRTALMAKRIAILYSQMRGRLRLRGKPLLAGARRSADE